MLVIEYGTTFTFEVKMADVSVCSFSSQLASACEHLVSYLDRSEKPVVGTTYKDIHQLVDQVAESGFFDAADHASAEPAADAAVMEPASDEAGQTTEPEPTAVGDGMSVLSVSYTLSHMMMVIVAMRIMILMMIVLL